MIDERNETENYKVIYNAESSMWELRRKVPGIERTIFMKNSPYQTAMIVAAREMEVRLAAS